VQVEGNFRFEKYGDYCGINYEALLAGENVNY
jgi:hypothetical protein